MEANRKEEREPAQAQRFLESILEGLPNPVFVKDEQHCWIVLNESFCRFMGYPRQELLGKSDHDFFPKEEADVFWAKDDVVFASGELVENEERFTDASGRLHVILTRKSLHHDERGRRFLLGVITDITQRKQMEEELRRSRDELDARVLERTAELSRVNQQLEEQDRHKTRFLGILSHELRNPLEPILNALHLLDRAGPGGAQALAARAVMGRQVEHLTKLVDDLLDTTRISRGKIQLRCQRVDLAELAARTVEDHRAMFARRDIALELERSGAAVVDADPTRVAQIIGNLLQNAAKFTSAGGRVLARVDREDGRARLRIRDTGTGIAPEMLGRIFDTFAQADETLHRSAGGLGLGLSLVKGLVELQHGTVEARSEGPGRGAEFTVSFPLAEGAAAAEEPRAPGAAGRHRRVLVVEDNLDAAETLRMMLELEGLEVAVAHDGQQGLERARDFHPDLVLCDLGLPEIDGYEVARALRADPTSSSVTLVAITGYALPDDQRRALDAGFDRHLAKPVSFQELESVIEGGARHWVGAVP